MPVDFQKVEGVGTEVRGMLDGVDDPYMIQLTDALVDIARQVPADSSLLARTMSVVFSVGGLVTATQKKTILSDVKIRAKLVAVIKLLRYSADQLDHMLENSTQ
jgi:hypothetical protein